MRRVFRFEKIILNNITKLDGNIICISYHSPSQTISRTLFVDQIRIKKCFFGIYLMFVWYLLHFVVLPLGVHLRPGLAQDQESGQNKSLLQHPEKMNDQPQGTHSKRKQTFVLFLSLSLLSICPHLRMNSKITWNYINLMFT